MTRIAIDAMGGDNAPRAIVEGAILARRELDVELVLVGPEEPLKQSLGAEFNNGIDVANATEVIEFDEQPVQAFRKKKDSSVRVGLNLVKDGQADAFMSAGSTGALLAGGLLTLGRLKGIDRPALSIVVPDAKSRPFLLLDVGANTDLQPGNLRDFAVMGSIYAERVLGIERPRVGLINIGTEASKGSSLVKDTLGLLSGVSSLNFVGNVEVRDLFSGLADVLVCDGWTGNIIIKTVEGVVSTLFGLIKEEIATDLRSKAGGLLVRPYLRNVAKRLDYSEFGGAPLLGLSKPCIKCHGSSGPVAIRNGVSVAQKFFETRVTALIGETINSQESGKQ